VPDPAPRTRNPRGQGERLRQELLAATVELLAEHRSPDAVTLRGVAAATGVSPTAVYRHFADRDELLRQAITWSWQRFDEALEVPDSGDPAADFHAQGLAYLRFASQESGIYRVLFSSQHHLPAREGDDGTHPGAPVFQKLVDRVAVLLGQRRDDRDPVFVALQVHTWIHGIADLECSQPEVPWPLVEHLLAELGSRLDLV
jgi:AcrR family transcriptional regulator